VYGSGLRHAVKAHDLSTHTRESVAAQRDILIATIRASS